jgi:hypothetical protein
MPAKGSRKCAGCGDYVQPAFDEVEWSRDGRLFCYACFENGEQYASRVIEIEPNLDAATSAITTTVFDEDFNYYTTYTDNSETETYGCDEDSYPVPIKSQGYQRTDGWRGYSTFEYLDDYESVASGWVTGFSDETTRRKADINDLLKDLYDGMLVAPCTLYVVMGITSNIFSQTCDVVVASQDAELLDKWLEEIGHSTAQIEEELS